MRLVVDASVLIGELFRVSGRDRLTDDRLDLFIAEHALEEVHHELPKRARRIGVRHEVPHDMEQLVAACFDAVDFNVATIPAAVYAPYEGEARWRSVRDPDDWPTVAAAMAVDAAVWTEDHDFFGTGVATWTTATVRAWLQRQPDR